MAQDVEELFGAGGGQPRPRLPLVIGLLVSGLLLAVLGLVCSAAPGGVLVLLAWVILEKELDRVDSGFLPEADRPRLQRVQWVAFAAMLAVIGLFALQGWLFCQGFYEALWAELLNLFLT